MTFLFCFLKQGSESTYAQVLIKLGYPNKWRVVSNNLKEVIGKCAKFIGGWGKVWVLLDEKWVYNKNEKKTSVNISLNIIKTSCFYECP